MLTVGALFTSSALIVTINESETVPSLPSSATTVMVVLPGPSSIIVIVDPVNETETTSTLLLVAV